MGAPVRFHTAPFSHWAEKVQGEASSLPQELYAEGGSSHPFCSTACIDSCCSLLGTMDRDHMGRECCHELVTDGVFYQLGKGTAAHWESISERLLQRVGRRALHPAWLQEEPAECHNSVAERLRRACCSSEVAVLMLRLAVRSACLASSWYGPWESREALQQLIRAEAWSFLLRALKALLDSFRADLAKQYNAVNIVSDILHILYSLSERHTHLDFRPSEIECGGLPVLVLEALYVVVAHAASLPKLHRQQATHGDTALLIAPSIAMLVVKSCKAGQVQVFHFMYSNSLLRKLLSESLSGFESGRLPGGLGDTPEAVDTGNAKFDPSPGKQPAHTLGLAMRLMIMISCCSKRSRSHFLLRSGMLLRCVHLLRHVLAACPAISEEDQGAGAQKLLRPPLEPARLPCQPEGVGLNALLEPLLLGVRAIAAFLDSWRPCQLPADEHHVTDFPSQCVGTQRSAPYEEVSCRETWARYDDRVEAMLDMGAAGVVESLLRTTVRFAYLENSEVLQAQAPLLAHAMLHHPRACPRQETALGLLISLRKVFQTARGDLDWSTEYGRAATLRIALLTAIVRKEALLPEHTAAFAATQLLPVIQAATERCRGGMPSSCYFVCKELLVMCSVLATSSAWPVLLGHRDLLMLAANMVLNFSNEGIPAYKNQSTVVDVVSIHAAACDLAIADSGFRTAVSASGARMLPSLLRINQQAHRQFGDILKAQGLLPLMDYQFGRALTIATMSESGWPRPLDFSARVSTKGCAGPHEFRVFVSDVEAALGCVPDWRRTPFWREASFMEAWWRFWHSTVALPASMEATAEVSQQDREEATRDPQPRLPDPSALENAASERLEARSLLLAGQAGLCCNPRCTELSGRHERSLRTLRCGGGCHHGRFCSKMCLRQAWPVHRLVCREDAAPL